MASTIDEIFQGMFESKTKQAADKQAAEINPALAMAQMVGQPGAFAAFYGNQRNQAMANYGGNITDKLSGGAYSSGERTTPDQLNNIGMQKMTDLLQSGAGETKEGQVEILKLAKAVDPQTAMALATKFNEANKAKDIATVSSAQTMAQRNSVAQVVKQGGRPDLVSSIMTGVYDTDFSKALDEIDVKTQISNGKLINSDTGEVISEVGIAPTYSYQTANGNVLAFEDGNLIGRYATQSEAQIASEARQKWSSTLSTIAAQAPMVSAIDQSLDMLAGNAYTTNLTGRIGSIVLEDDRINLEGTIDTVKSNTFLSALESLKAASANGSSGLGQVTEIEVNLLMSKIASLNMDLTTEQLTRNLMDIKLSLDNLNRIRAGLSPVMDYDANFSGGGLTTVVNGRRMVLVAPDTLMDMGADAEINLPGGTRYIRPDLPQAQRQPNSSQANINNIAPGI